MSQNSLSKWMKFILILMGVCGVVMFGVMFPSFGCDFAAQHPELEFGYIPWMIFITATAIPCYAVLVFGWHCNFGCVSRAVISCTQSDCTSGTKRPDNMR